MIFRVWIPGRFSLTNKMLSNLRAAEKFRGRRPKGWVDGFAQETQAIRLATAAAWRSKEPDVMEWGAVPSSYVCSVFFAVFGHHKHDPDAWYLLGKAVLDGLVGARVIREDRSDVWGTAGRVCESRAEELFLYTQNGGCVGAGVAPEGAGVLVALRFHERPVPRV